MKRITLGLLGAVAAVLLAGTVGAADLRVGLKLEPSSIDPHYHNLGPNNSAARHIFDRLVHTNEKQQLGPGLAVSWKPLSDTVWEFKLRQGVKFHDGSPFTADDVLSVANSYSRGDREFEKAAAMLFPSKVAQRGRMRDHTAAPFRRRVTV